MKIQHLKIRLSRPRGTQPNNAPSWQAVMRAALEADAEALAPDDVHAMRRTVVGAARDTAPGISWRRPVAIAATILLMIGVGATAGRRFDTRRPAAVPVEQIRPGAGEQLQLQFATPGGTRIIWVFNPELELKAMVP
jgi:hypothetical protein